MNNTQVNQGDVIEDGTPIGQVSDVNSPGVVHLHFEVGIVYDRINPYRFDPHDWIRLMRQWGYPEGAQNGFFTALSTIQFPTVCICPPRWPEQPARQGRRTDPLVVDLAGNGIQTVGLSAGIYFDYDGDGFAELTGWVAPGNGFLMLDRNDNNSLDTGLELFGDSTLLPNGMRAANGFQALAAHDYNGDGKIDANDPIWSQLRIWQVTSVDADSGDQHAMGSIISLDELGITAIYVDSAISNKTDESGNIEIRSGHFEWADGSAGAIAEYSLQRDTSNTFPTEYLEVPSEIGVLPDVTGFGNVHTLHQAMVRDSSGQLKALVEAFASETSPATRATILDQIIFKWTGADSVAPNARGPFMDGRKLVALENLYGQSRES